MDRNVSKEFDGDIDNDDEGEANLPDEGNVKSFQCGIFGKSFQFPNNLIAYNRHHTNNSRSTNINTVKTRNTNSTYASFVTLREMILLSSGITNDK